MSSIDVVIPCYNYGRYLRDCVGSILAQQGVDVRILVIDNASSDDSLAVAHELASEDRRVEIIAHAVNRGATFSYNEGIDWASADYFLILDADDMLAPGALLRAVAVLEAHPGITFTHGIEGRIDAAATTSLHHSVETAWTLMGGRHLIERLCRTPVNRIGANTVIRRTAAQKSVGYYRASLPYTDDLEMWLRLAMTGDVASIRAVQALRRYHPDRMSVHYQEMQVRDFVERQAAFESFFSHEGSALPDAPRLLATARRGLAEHAYWSALSHLCRGYRHTAFELLRLSHRGRPHALFLPPVAWLARMDDPWKRTGQILREALGARRRSSRQNGRAAQPEPSTPGAELRSIRE